MPDGVGIFSLKHRSGEVVMTNRVKVQFEKQRFRFVSFQRMWTTQEWLAEGHAVVGERYC